MQVRASAAPRERWGPAAVKEVPASGEKYWLACSGGVSAAETVGDAVGTDWLVTKVPRVLTASTFLFDIDDFSICRHFPISPGHTPASHWGETEETNETHIVPASDSASSMPRKGCDAND